MYIEKSKTIVADGTQADYLRDSARHLLNIYRLCGSDANAPEAARKAWGDIKACLEASSDDLTETQKQKWERLYLSYLAEGNPPTPEFSEAYRYYKEAATKEQWPVLPLTDAVRSVFAGMSALPLSNSPPQSQEPFPNANRARRLEIARGGHSVAIDFVLTFLCSAYLGYQHDPYSAVVLCSTIVAAYVLWDNRDLLKRAKADSYGAGSVFTIYAHLSTLLIFVSFVVCFLAVGSAAYFSMAYLHG